MNRAMVGLVTLVLIGGSVGMLVPEAEASSSGSVRFGMQSSTVSQQTNAGVKPDYGVFWIGPWTLSSGWGGPNSEMSKMSSAGVTPAIHFYYWGDDISPSCVENGCWSSLHNTWKDKAGWQKLAQQLVNNMHAQMGGKKVVIFLETEFNKGGIDTYEPFDGYLAAKAAFIKKNYPNAEVVMALGNWNSGAWSTFDRTASASDYVGIQGMRGSTRDSATKYDTLYESTLNGAKKAQSLFGKPIFIQDIALSSYPEPNYLKPQADALKKFFDGMPQLKAAGVKALVYRAWYDAPGMDLANYYGKAERHWGVTYVDGKWKPAASVWVNGVKAERSGSSTSGSSSGSFSATFTPASSVNEWWADVSIKGDQPVAKAWIKVNGGPWYSMSKSDWGTWTKSMNIPKGSSVIFRAQSTGGEYATSQTFTWMSSGSGASPTPSGSSFSADFSPASSVNEWWVDVSIKGTEAVGKAWVRVDGGSWNALSKSDWGSWTKSMKVPKGSNVQFRAQSTSGAYDNSGTFTWMSSGSAPSPTPTGPSFSADFSPASSVNEWWVDVSIKGSEPVGKAWVRVDGGSWNALSKSDWGSWTKSMKVPKGSSVQFRAQSTSGAYDNSGTFTWMSSGSSFSASFAPSDSVNAWWVDVAVKGSKPVSKVHVKVNGGSWIALEKTDWGTWAKSTHAPKGSSVVFKATASSGETTTSQTFKW